MPTTYSHHVGHMSLYGNDANYSAFVVFPYGFYNPSKRVSIRAIRPIFDVVFNGTDSLTMTATVRSMSSGIAPSAAIVKTNTGSGNDLNLTIADCPFADKHSISIELTSANGLAMIFNLVGVEVEYEEDVLVAK